MIEDLRALLAQGNIVLTDEAQDRLLAYHRLLLEWNARMDLTNVPEEEMALRHYADSLLPLARKEWFPDGARLIDVGTGAGFPGVPLLIMRPDLHMTLLDSLAKRLTFLEELLPELGVARVPLLHARAEDAGRDNGLRGKFDIALTRAVASAPALLEWTIPLLKVGGASLMYKGPKAEEELASCVRAETLLRCTAQLKRFPAPWGERLVIEARKTAPTPGAYPRKAGTATKDPL